MIDELVAYVRQFPESQAISGGSYDSNLSFVQALTEAVKLVPRAIVLASLPESELEAGSQRGVAALRALEKTFGRVQALWKPVATVEAFEIVRRRLFEPVRDEKTHEAVCRAFADVYIAEGAKLPSETQERRYYERLVQAYPIHPEVFDRLYEDWTTIEGFQRTRGVLKLMAKVIYRLWKDDNKDLLIMPGSLPLHDGSSRNELTYYLPAGWDAVIERDIDGERAETTELESKEPRFGQVGAARRIARTIFLGSAPSSVATKETTRGIDRARIILGWGSIVEDVKEARLNIDLLQKNQAEKEQKTAEEVLPRAVRECYKWLLCPMVDSPTDPKPEVEAFALTTTGGTAGGEIERVCADNELMISSWSPIHLRAKLKELYWKGGDNSANAEQFFEDTLRYLYMPRLRNRDVLAQAIRTGAASRDFFGIAYGKSNGKFEGFSFGDGNVVFDDTLLLIEPEAAKAYEEDNPRDTETGKTKETEVAGKRDDIEEKGKKEPPSAAPGTLKPHTFFGSADVPAATAKMHLVQLADEIVSVLVSDPNATVRLVVEISAEFPEGASDNVKRAVSENARVVGLKSADWE